MSKPTRTRPKTQLSRAAIKAYEARRAEEVNRLESEQAATDGPIAVSTARRSFTLSRAEEFSIIRSDLRRLLMILAVLAVMLVVATFILR